MIRSSIIPFTTVLIWFVIMVTVVFGIVYGALGPEICKGAILEILSDLLR